MVLLATPGESEERRIQAATGRLSFGYFSLAEQRKVARRRGRDPDSIKRRGSDSLDHNVTHPRRHSLIARGNETIYFKISGYVSNQQRNALVGGAETIFSNDLSLGI